MLLLAWRRHTQPRAFQHGRLRALDLFRKFKADKGAGPITVSDFMRALDEVKVKGATEESVVALMRHLDRWVTVTFSKKTRSKCGPLF